MSQQKIYFPYESSKATQAILWLLEKHNGILSKLKLVKLIYFADKEHVLRFGRPIAGGDYFALPHGPASSELLNHINAATSTSSYPFVLEANIVKALAAPDLEQLSESDIQILEKTNSEYGHFSASYLRDLTHQLKEWILNFGRRKEGASRYPMPYEDFFDNETDGDMLEIIRDEQGAWAGLD